MAWQPLTFHGVASFAHAPWRRLGFVQLIMALISGGVLVWFCELNVVPVINSIIGQLPENCQISQGRLDWKGVTPLRLAENPFFDVVVDLDQTGQFGQTADCLLLLSERQCQVSSLLGRRVFPYPDGWIFMLDPLFLRPRWEAWHPFLSLSLGAVWCGGLMVIWSVLALVYTPVVAILSALMNREFTWGNCYCVAGAALLPGALFFDMALVLYSFRQTELIGFVVAFGLHLVVGWIYLLLAPSCLPACELNTSPVSNPFATGPK
jgi:hypothetical protein